jgi:type IV pilus assembly protein PilQ
MQGSKTRARAQARKGGTHITGKSARRQKKRVAALTAIACVLSATLSWADGGPNHVRDVKVHAAEGIPGGTEIEVVGTGTPVFSVRVTDGGRRLLVDLNNADVAGAPEAITNASGLVGGVLTQAFKNENGSVTRLIVSLARQATYRVRADGTTLRVTLTPGEPTVTTTAAVVSAPAPVKAAPVAGNASAAGLALEDVRFERLDADKAKERGACSCDRVVLALSSIPSYQITAGDAGRVRLELKGVSVPAAQARMLDVASYGGPLKSVTTFGNAATGAAIVEIEPRAEAGVAPSGNVTVEGSHLVWSFERARGAGPASGSMSAKGATGSHGKVVTVAREEGFVAPPRIETSFHAGDVGGDANAMTVETAGGGQQAGFLSSVQPQASAGGGGRFTGRRIDLDLKDADVHNILRLLADVGRVNIVTADDVSGNITIRMRNVPWDQALDVVLQSKGLGMIRQGNLIRVAPLAQLQKERELRLAQQRAEFELTPTETRLIPVNYATASELQARAKDLLSPRGSLAVDERTNTLIARDVTGVLNHIEELVRSLDHQTAQVLVEARIVEATSRYLRDVGIQWGGDATFSEATGNPTGIAFPSKVTAAGGGYDGNTPTAGLSPFTRNVPTPNFAVNLPAAVGTGQGGALGLTFGSVDNNFNIGVRLSAAEVSGLVRIVSSPRILTLDNREARINQGTLIPFSQVSAQGVQTTFQEAKLQLLVRPHVTADGAVAMHVKVNRDEPDFTQTSARGDPTILKREAETDLLVMDGHTAVIGGIFTRNTGRNLDQVPFFGDIPILGILFQRRRASDARNELVIFLTPRIVNRAEALGR